MRRSPPALTSAQGTTRAFTAASAARSAVHPFATPPRSSPTSGRESQPSGAHVDLGPAAARLRRVQDTPRAGEHLVVVAVVAGGDDRVQDGRVEEPFRAFRLTEREPDEPLEPGAHVRPSAGVRVHRRELAVAAEPREPLLLASEDVR